MEMKDCKDCAHWNKQDMFSDVYGLGVCEKSKSGYVSQDVEMIAWDDIEAYEPFLLTRPDFGCKSWQDSKTKEVK